MLIKKLDRRKKYTRMVLKESLMKLLKIKQISNITVKEICELADINRSTYYSHYADQYDLLYKIEDEILEDMNNTLSRYNFSEEEEALQMTEKLLEYVSSKSDIFQTLLNDHGDPTFQNKAMMLTQQLTIKNELAISGEDKKITEYISLMVVSGSIHVIKKWLENEMDRSPKEMAKVINNFTNKGLSFYR